MKIELSLWEAGQLISLMSEFDFIIQDKALENNHYVVACKKRIEKDIRLRQNSLLRKMESSARKSLKMSDSDL